jgi:Uma2 family endonuclease
MAAIAASNDKKRAKVYTFAQYLAYEERSLEKNEFYNGQIIPMSGSKFNHNLIATNVMRAIGNKVENMENDYLVLNSDQKVYIEAENVALYPDALVICGQPEFWNGREDLITNPIVIVEVLSKSTRKYDLTDKFLLYQNLPSFKEYITIEPYKSKVCSWYHQDSETWKTSLVTDLTQAVWIRSLDITILLSDIYRKVIFKK